MTRSLLGPWWLAAALVAAGPAAAESLFPVDNQGALARSFALPALGQAQLPAAGQQQWRVALDWTNEYFYDRTATETLNLDGESQRYSLSWRRGVGAGFEVNAEMPLLVTGGGVLDGLIQNWHHLWGLPDGGRNQVANGQYQYLYVHNGRTLLDVTTPAAGLGDLTLGGGWQALPDLAVRTMVKLPTGDGSRLLGGNAGMALWADYDPFAATSRWTGFLSAGVSVNDAGPVLTSQQHHTLGLAGAGAGYHLTPRWRVLGQLYGHTQLYRDSGLKALRREGLQLALGGRYEFTGRRAITFGFQEDLVTDSSPDFSIHLDYRFP